ncbi:MAG: hypothetical protein O3A63_08130 [Proteobacteria bacterium]|nr:hypothetical protein [Pseudomonadota bacterium]
MNSLRYHSIDRYAVLLTSLVVAITFAWPLSTRTYLPAFDLYHLGYLMQLQWLVLASGLFLFIPLIIPVMVPSVSYIGMLIRMLCYAGIVYAFGTAIYADMGFAGVVNYVVLIYVTYGGSSLFVREASIRESRSILAVARWIVLLPIFFTLVVFYDLGEGSVESWDGRFAAVKLGATFYSILFMLEIALFRWGPTWSRALRATSGMGVANDEVYSKTEARRSRFYAAMREPET